MVLNIFVIDMLRSDTFAVECFDPNELVAFPETFFNWAFCAREHRPKPHHELV